MYMSSLFPFPSSLSVLFNSFFVPIIAFSGADSLSRGTDMDTFVRDAFRLSSGLFLSVGEMLDPRPVALLLSIVAESLLMFFSCIVGSE